MKKLFTFSLFLLFAAVVLFTSCGKNEKSEEQQAMENMQKAAEAMKQTGENMQKGMPADRKPVPPVSFRVLMNYLPTSVSGLKADKPEGESTSMGEWNFSIGKVQFQSENGEQNARVEISDFAYINALYMPYQFLFNMNYSHESSSGYEKGAKANGYPAMEKWTIESTENEITVLVGERFLVHVETRGLGEGSAKKIAESINLSKLAGEKAG